MALDRGFGAGGFGAGGGEQFEIGKVISTSLAVFSRNLLPFSVIALLIGIPYIIVTIFAATSPEEIEAATRAGTLPPGFFVSIGIGVLIFLLTNTLAQSAINYGTFQDLRGQRPSFADCLSRGFATLPKVIVAAILASLGIGVASLLLVIPGIILSLMWWVFVPVIVVEGTSAIDCFGRSRDLTRGHRWGILGLLLIAGIAQWLVALGVGFVAAMIGGVVAQILDQLVTVVFTAFTSVMTAVGYFYLRAEKEGILIDDIAKVFD